MNPTSQTISHNGSARSAESVEELRSTEQVLQSAEMPTISSPPLTLSSTLLPQYMLSSLTSTSSPYSQPPPPDDDVEMLELSLYSSSSSFSQESSDSDPTSLILSSYSDVVQKNLNEAVSLPARAGIDSFVSRCEHRHKLSAPEFYDETDHIEDPFYIHPFLEGRALDLELNFGYPLNVDIVAKRHYIDYLMHKFEFSSEGSLSLVVNLRIQCQVAISNFHTFAIQIPTLYLPMAMDAFAHQRFVLDSEELNCEIFMMDRTLTFTVPPKFEAIIADCDPPTLVLDPWKPPKSVSPFPAATVLLLCTKNREYAPEKPRPRVPVPCIEQPVLERNPNKKYVFQSPKLVRMPPSSRYVLTLDQYRNCPHRFELGQGNFVRSILHCIPRIIRNFGVVYYSKKQLLYFDIALYELGPLFHTPNPHVEYNHSDNRLAIVTPDGRWFLDPVTTAFCCSKDDPGAIPSGKSQWVTRRSLPPPLNVKCSPHISNRIVLDHIWKANKFVPIDSFPEMIIDLNVKDRIVFVYKQGPNCLPSPFSNLLNMMIEYGFDCPVNPHFHKYVAGIRRGIHPVVHAAEKKIIMYEPKQTLAMRSLLNFHADHPGEFENFVTVLKHHRVFRKLLPLLRASQHHKTTFTNTPYPAVAAAYRQIRHAEIPGQGGDNTWNDLCHNVISGVVAAFGTVWSVFAAAGAAATSLLDDFTWIKGIVTKVRMFLTGMVKGLQIALPLIAAACFVYFLVKFAQAWDAIRACFSAVHKIFTYFWFTLMGDEEYNEGSPLSNVDWDGVAEADTAPKTYQGQSIFSGLSIAGIMFSFLTSFSFKQSKDFLHGVGDLGRATSTVPQLLELGRQFIDWCSFFLTKQLWGKGEYFFQSTVAEKTCQALYEEVQTKLHENNRPISEQASSSAEWCADIMDKVYKYERAYALVYRDGKVRAHYRDLSIALKKIMLEVRAHNPRSTKPRRVVNILIVSSPKDTGCGKNTFAVLLCQVVYEVVRALLPNLKWPEWNSTMLFKKPKTSPFCDGVGPFTFAWIFDELLNEMDPQDRALAILTVMELTDDYPVQLDMSAIEDKGTIFSNQYLNVITCPSHQWNKCGIEQHGALPRRMDAVIRPVRSGDLFTLDDSDPDFVDSAMTLYSSHAVALEWDYDSPYYISDQQEHSHIKTIYPIRKYRGSYLLPLGKVSFRTVCQKIAALIVAYKEHPHLDDIAKKVNIKSIISRVEATCLSCLKPRKHCDCCPSCHNIASSCRCLPEQCDECENSPCKCALKEALEKFLDPNGKDKDTTYEGQGFEDDAIPGERFEVKTGFSPIESFRSLGSNLYYWFTHSQEAPHIPYEPSFSGDERQLMSQTDYRYNADWYYCYRRAVLSCAQWNPFSWTGPMADAYFRIGQDERAMRQVLVQAVLNGVPHDPITLGHMLIRIYVSLKPEFSNEGVKDLTSSILLLPPEEVVDNITKMRILGMTPATYAHELVALATGCPEPFVEGYGKREFENCHQYYIYQVQCAPEDRKFMLMSAIVGNLFLQAVHKTQPELIPSISDEKRQMYFSEVYTRSWWTRVKAACQHFWNSCGKFSDIKKNMLAFKTAFWDSYDKETFLGCFPRDISQHGDWSGMFPYIQESYALINAPPPPFEMPSRWVIAGLFTALVTSFSIYVFSKSPPKDELKLKLTAPGQTYDKVSVGKKLKKYAKGQTMNDYQKITVNKKLKKYAHGQYLPEVNYKAPKLSGDDRTRMIYNEEGVFFQNSLCNVGCSLSEKRGTLTMCGTTQYVLCGSKANISLSRPTMVNEGMRAKRISDFNPTLTQYWWYFKDQPISLYPYQGKDTFHWILFKEGDPMCYLMSPTVLGQTGTWNDLAKHKVRSVANNIFRYQLKSKSGSVNEGFCFSPGGRDFVMTKHEWMTVDESAGKVSEFSILHADQGNYLNFYRKDLTITFPEDRCDKVMITVNCKHLPSLPSLKKRLRRKGAPMPDGCKIARIARIPNGKNVDYYSLVFESKLERNLDTLNIAYNYKSDRTEHTISCDTMLEIPGAIGEFGDCGQVYVLFDSRTGLTDIIGIHNGTYGGSGMCVPLYLDDFPNLQGERLDYLHYGNVPDLPRYQGQCAKDSYPIYAGTRQLGVNLLKPAFVPQKTVFKKSAIYNDLADISEIPVAPADLHYSVHEKTFIKLSECSGIDSLPPEIDELLEKEPERVFEGWLPRASNKTFTMFDIEEALFSDDLENLTSMDLTKSQTYEFFVLAKKRKALYGRDNAPDPNWRIPYPHKLGDGKKWINPLLRKMVKALFDHIDEGGEVQCLSTACWKDELRSLEAVALKKTRLFCVGGFTIAIACKMMFGDLVRTKTDFTIRPSKIGVNAFSEQWEWIHQLLSTHPNLFGGDCSGWDYRVRNLFLYLFCEFLKTLKVLPLHRSRMMALARTVMGTTLVYTSNLVERLFGVPSGHWLTSYFNTFANYCAHKIVWIIRNPDPENLHWKNHVKMIFYGDDNGGCVSDECSSWFNMTVIAEVFASMGMGYTTPDKKTVSDAFLDWKSFQFLSRSFAYRKEIGRHVAPLEMSSIIGMLAYVRDPKDFSRTHEEQLCINIEVASRELSLHKPEIANAFTGILNSFIIKRNLPMALLRDPSVIFREVSL